MQKIVYSPTRLISAHIDTIPQSMWNQEMKLVFRSTCNQKATKTEKKQTCKDKTKSNTKKSVMNKF